MADRYWVGGTAAWDGTAGTKWATQSGGTGGAAVPTAADDVFFDGASGAVTCTISGSRVAKSINCTGFTGTLAGTSTPALTISGSLTLSAGMTLTYAGTTTFNSSFCALTSAGKTLGPVTLNGASTTLILSDALNIGTNALTITQGIFQTGSYNITAGSISSSGSILRQIYLENSTVTLSGSTPLNFATNSALSFFSGNSQINLTSTATTIAGGSASSTGVTFYNVSFTSNTATTHTIQSINTFNNFSVTGPTSIGVTQVTFDSQQTINGALSTTGTAGNRRIWFRSSTSVISHTLTINGTPSLTDADFSDLYVVGTAAPISGTRIGDLRGCTGITFSTPKTVYWNLSGTQNWSANGWASTSSGTPNTDNFPLAQDTGVFTNDGAAGTVTIDNAIPYIGGFDQTARTTAMTFALQTAYSVPIYGDVKLSPTITYSGATARRYLFVGRKTQIFISSGRNWPHPITVDSPGGTVELGDAASSIARSVTITAGTFDTKSYNMTLMGVLNTSGNLPKTIKFGSSVGEFASFDFAGTNLTFDAGTSTLSSYTDQATNNFGNVTLYDLTFTRASVSSTTTQTIGGTSFNCRNFTIGVLDGGIKFIDFACDAVITGTLTAIGVNTRRIFIRSNSRNTIRTLTVNSLDTTDCDFRDITIAGAAAGSSQTRAGDCGGNSGITFPSPKTVYWNLSGTQNWSANGWAGNSGGSPAANNFPLAQDTAVFNENGSAGTVTIDASFNIGTVDLSSRTSAMTFSSGTATPQIYGDWKWGTGVTSSNTAGVLTFVKNGTQTITSNNVEFGCPINVNSVNGTVQLADAILLNSTRTFTLTGGTFDAVTYNVTAGLVNISGTTSRTLKMGSGTWTLSGTGTVWDAGTPTNLNFYKGTANITLSSTSTAARTFAGGDLSYNKLTIGGTTGTSTTTISNNNFFEELASTKTVAHTIALGSLTQTFGKWTVTGTSGNVVTLTGTSVNHKIVGDAVSGIDYLVMGTVGFVNTGAEFYAGANSTGSAGAPVYRTAKPADGTRYWVGGTGNWSDTARWSESSNGPGGASVPRSHDDVVFNSSSNTASYTATINTTARCKSLTIAGPASGNLTLAGTSALYCHGNVTLPATGLIRTYSGTINLTGSTTGKTFTTNGVALGSGIVVEGVGCEWTLGSALDIQTNSITLTAGILDFSTYNVTYGEFASNNRNSRSIKFGTGTLTSSAANPINFGTTETNAANLTVTAGTGQINVNNNNPTFNGNGKTFYNVSFKTQNASTTVALNGINSFNNLTFDGIAGAGYKNIVLSANQTVTGTLTFSAGTTFGSMRQFCRSDTVGTTRTITAAAVSMTDVDFRDITIAGAAAPASGTRIGDCKGNSGITFTTPKTVYWNFAAGGNWSDFVWAAQSGGSPLSVNFPLPQDTCIIENAGLNTGATVTINANWNVGTIDASTRTNLATIRVGGSSTNALQIYGNIILSSFTNISYSTPTTVTLCGRSSQTITSAGSNIVLGTAFNIDSPGGSVTLLDALSMPTLFSGTIILTQGTFNTGGYSVTTNGFTSTSSASRTLNLSNSTWNSVNTSGTVWNVTSSGFTFISNNAAIALAGAGAKTFGGGNVNYSGTTLDNANSGTLTITGNNTFKDITNSYKSTGAAIINFGTTTQTLSQFTAAGEAGRLLTLTGTSAASPGAFVFTGTGTISSDYLTITGIRAFPTTSTWYAGTNSTNNGSLGWLFESAPVAAATTSNFFMLL